MDTKKSLAFGLSLLLHLALFSSLAFVELPAGSGENQIIQIELAGWAQGGATPAGIGQQHRQAPAATLPVKTALRQPKTAPQVSPASSADRPPSPPGDRPQMHIEPVKTETPTPSDPLPHHPVLHFFPAHHVHPRKAKRTTRPGKAAAGEHNVATPQQQKSTGLADSSAKAVANSAAKKTAGAATGGMASKASAAKARAGVRGSSRSRIGSYLAAVRARIEAAKRYPPSARRRRIEGKAQVRFRLAADGRLLDLRLIASSGFHALDQAALSAVRRAAPFPRFPRRSSLTSRSFQVKIAFVLRSAH